MAIINLLAPAAFPTRSQHLAEKAAARLHDSPLRVGAEQAPDSEHRSNGSITFEPAAIAKADLLTEITSPIFSVAENITINSRQFAEHPRYQ
jgi:hypothetical protein